MRLVTAILLTAFVGSFLSSCGNPDHALSTLRRGIGGDPSTLDPGQAVDTFSSEIIRDLYEGLVTESASGDIEPGVAADWLVDPSGRVYTFRIREDARWSNGDPVTAPDFVRAWRRLVTPSYSSAVAQLLLPVLNASEVISGRMQPEALGVTASNTKTLVVHLQKPAPYFPQLLTHTATFPIHAQTPDKVTSSPTSASNGPYILSQWIPGLRISLRKNKFYWNRDSVRIAAVDYIPTPDEDSEFRQYRADQLDVTQSVPVSALTWVRKTIPNELEVSPFLGVSYYALNARANGPLQSKLLRQALAMALDRKRIQTTLLPFGQKAAYGFVPPGTWNYSPQAWGWQNLSDESRLRVARLLYERAGYSQSRPLRLRLLINSNTTIRQISIAVAAMWTEVLGVQTELIEEEYRVFLDSRKDESRWEVVRLGWSADYNDARDFLDTFRSGSPNNDSGYSDPDYDSLVDQAEEAADPTIRKELLERAESTMLSNYPVIPLYFYCTKRLIKPYVIGAKDNSLGRLYSRHLSFDRRN